MAIYDTYSKRNSPKSDVYIYNVLSDKLKIQIAYIWKNFFNQIIDEERENIWKAIHKVICEEHGKETLLEDSFVKYKCEYKVESYFKTNIDINNNLDVIQLVFGLIEHFSEYIGQRNFSTFNGNYTSENAINDLNTRFLENGVGYEFQNGRIIRIDNLLLHNEIIKPTLQFLSDEIFKNANDEFLNAHLHFKNKENEDCLVDCLKALESTMKIICMRNNWAYNENDTAKKLIEVCIKNKLIPDYLNSEFSAIRTVLESGAPTIRNRLGGHGQGPKKVIVPDYFASYMLYLTGATINFLISCQQGITSFKEL